MSRYIHDSPYAIEEEIYSIEGFMKQRFDRLYEDLQGASYSDAMVVMKLTEVIHDNMAYVESFMQDMLPLITEHYKKYYNHYNNIKDNNETE